MEDSKAKKRSLIFVVSILSLIIGGGIGYLTSTIINKLNPEEQKLVDEYRILKEEWLYGNEEAYLHSLAGSGLVETASKKDPYLIYTSTEQEQGLSTDGNGFGFSSRHYDGGLYIAKVFENSTAHKAGIRVGDVLYSVKIENQETYDFRSHTYAEITEKLSSVKDTTTKFTFQSASKSYILVRGPYSEDLVTVIDTPKAENGNTMVIKINTFLGRPTDALIGSLHDYADKIDTLVFDLRGNGGGYLSQAYEMAKLFVKKDTMVYQLRDKNNRVIEEAKQTIEPTYSIPHYKIIMDHMTASASETFTLAMRAGCDTTTYGLTSYGKGIAQSFKNFSDGSVLRYTKAYVYGPEKESETMYEEEKDADSIMCIHEKGILPDYAFEKDYYYLASSCEFNSLAISQTGQLHFLKALNDIYPSLYPSTYSSTFLYADAVRQFGEHMALVYHESELAKGFDDTGSMMKRLNDIFNKETYDKYLEYYGQVMTWTLGV